LGAEQGRAKGAKLATESMVKPHQVWGGGVYKHGGKKGKGGGKFVGQNIPHWDLPR